jgi:hypothetical protein
MICEMDSEVRSEKNRFVAIRMSNMISNKERRAQEDEREVVLSHCEKNFMSTK